MLKALQPSKDGRRALANHDDLDSGWLVCTVCKKITGVIRWKNCVPRLPFNDTGEVCAAYSPQAESFYIECATFARIDGQSQAYSNQAWRFAAVDFQPEVITKKELGNFQIQRFV